MVKRLRPLKGRRVVELCGLLPCPMLGLLLSDLGAEVTKVEPPEGDPVRGVPPLAFGVGLMYHALNRGKRVVKLNIKQKAQRKSLIKTISSSDILMEGFRPGVMERLGLDPDYLTGLNPDLLIVRMSAFGQNLPDRPAHDLNLMALSGALGVQDGDQPLPVQAADMTTALIGAIAVLSALSQGITGVLDVPLFYGAHFIGFPVYTRFTKPKDLRENRLLEGGNPLYRLYSTGDQRRVSVAALEPGFVQQVMGVTGLKDVSEKALTSWFSARTLNEVIQAFSEKAACVEPVLMPWEVSEKGFSRPLFAPLSYQGSDFLLPITPFADQDRIPAGPWVDLDEA